MKEKIYRPNVAAVILSSEYPHKKEIFIAQRSDIKGAWQFPQGGIDAGETPKLALERELKEEIGTNDIEILLEYPEWISYDFPKYVLNKKANKFAGQSQKYFLVKLNKEAHIDLYKYDKEFNAYKFVNSDEVLDFINHFKRETYKKVLEYFKKEGKI